MKNYFLIEAPESHSTDASFARLGHHCEVAASIDMPIVQETRFEDTCEISGIRHGNSVTGEILTFREKDLIIATIQRSAKVTLRWQPHANAYIGSLGGVEFQTQGPKSQTFRTRR